MKTHSDRQGLPPISRRDFVSGAGMALAGGCLLRAGSANAAETPDAREASWYQPLEDGRVKCGLCPKGCVVPPGQRGFCRVRENRGGKYYSLAYGRPVAANLDPIEKKPLYHVYPGTKAYSIATVGCNFTCKFCQNWDISQASPEDAPVPLRAPAQIAEAAGKAGAKTIAYTYNEPTVFGEYILDCAKAGKDRGVESVMVSNGFICAKPQEELLKLLKAVKIDLKAFRNEFYTDLCGGSLEPVKDSLKRIAGSGVWLEIVVLLIPTLNDNPDELKRMTAWIVKELGPTVPVIFTAYHPAYKIRNIPPTPTAALEKACGIAREEGCSYAYGGNVPGFKGANTYCPKCGEIVVERYGYLIKKTTEGKCARCGEKIPGVWL